MYGIENHSHKSIDYAGSQWDIGKVKTGDLFFNVGSGKVRRSFERLVKNYCGMSYSRYTPSTFSSLVQLNDEAVNRLVTKKYINEKKGEELIVFADRAHGIASMIERHSAPIIEGLNPDGNETKLNSDLTHSTYDELKQVSENPSTYYGVTLELYGHGQLTKPEVGKPLVVVSNAGFHFRMEGEGEDVRAVWPFRDYDSEQELGAQKMYQPHNILLNAVLLGKDVAEVVGMERADLPVSIWHGEFDIHIDPLQAKNLDCRPVDVSSLYEDFATEMVRVLNPDDKDKLQELRRTIDLQKALIGFDASKQSGELVILEDSIAGARVKWDKVKEKGVLLFDRGLEYRLR
jgi:hypothetical protein